MLDPPILVCCWRRGLKRETWGTQTYTERISLFRIIAA